MSNYGLACMILDIVIEGFDISYSYDRYSTGDRSGSEGDGGNSTDDRNGPEDDGGNSTDDRSGSEGDGGKGVLPAKDDEGKLISCDTPGEKSLKEEELSNIEILNRVGAGADNIIFKYDGQEFDWNSSMKKLGEGSYGEVKLFKLSGGKNVAIKKYPLWKIKKDEETNMIVDIIPLKDYHNEGIILQNIKEKCIKNKDQCINKLCDIVPAHHISSSTNETKFLINTGLSDEQVAKMAENDIDPEYSFIAMEAMTGSLKKYSIEQKDNLDGEKDKKKIPKLLDDIFMNVTKIILKVANLLKCLSDKGYYYTDLKSDNVLYKCDGGNIIIKLGDIGSLTTERNLRRRVYVRTYVDSQGLAKEKEVKMEEGGVKIIPSSVNYSQWKSNPKYYHVYLLGYLYIEILANIFNIKFGEEDIKLKAYTIEKQNNPNDEQISIDIKNFISKINTRINEDLLKDSPKYSFTSDYYDAVKCNITPFKSCIGEQVSELINTVLHKTIVSQLELSEEGRRDILAAEQKRNTLINESAGENEVIRANKELIETKHKHSFRYANESDLISVLGTKIDNINSGKEWEEY